MGAGSGFRGGAFHGGGQRLTLAEANVNVGQIHHVAPSWLIFRNGCPGGEAPEQVSRE